MGVLIKENEMDNFFKRWAREQFDEDCTGTIPLKMLSPFISHLGKPISKIKLQFDKPELLLGLEIRVRPHDVDENDLGQTKLHCADVIRGIERHVTQWNAQKQEAYNNDANPLDKQAEHKKKGDGVAAFLGAGKTRRHSFMTKPEGLPYKKYRERLKKPDEPAEGYKDRMLMEGVDETDFPETAWVIPKFLLEIYDREGKIP